MQRSASKPLVVADAGLNHNGDIRMAKSMIALAAAQGVDFIKFQTRRNMSEVYKDSYLSPKKKAEKENLEFSREEYDEIDAYCRDQKIAWFSSPWDVEAVEFLATYGVPYMKIASVCLTNKPLLEAVKKTGIPVILSTGMSHEGQIVKACSFFGPQIHYVLQCVAKYPCDDQDMHMSRISRLRDLTGHRVGFSNHSPKTFYMLVAAMLGVSMIEFHMTMDNDLTGPDHKASIGPTKLAALMKLLPAVSLSLGSGEIIPSEEELGKGKHYAWR